jgi:hypothetical protein
MKVSVLLALQAYGPGRRESAVAKNFSVEAQRVEHSCQHVRDFVPVIDFHVENLSSQQDQFQTTLISVVSHFSYAREYIRTIE